MLEKFDVIKPLKSRFSQSLECCLDQIPEDHRTTSLHTAVRCELSYQQGYRDAMTKALVDVKTQERLAEEELDSIGEDMYLQHMQSIAQE